MRVRGRSRGRGRARGRVRVWVRVRVRVRVTFRLRVRVRVRVDWRVPSWKGCTPHSSTCSTQPSAHTSTCGHGRHSSGMVGRVTHA